MVNKMNKHHYIDPMAVIILLFLVGVIFIAICTRCSPPPNVEVDESGVYLKTTRRSDSTFATEDPTSMKFENTGEIKDDEEYGVYTGLVNDSIPHYDYANYYMFWYEDSVYDARCYLEITPDSPLCYGWSFDKFISLMFTKDNLVYVDSVSSWNYKRLYVENIDTIEAINPKVIIYEGSPKFIKRVGN